jgi:hypothetical protein
MVEGLAAAVAKLEQEKAVLAFVRGGENLEVVLVADFVARVDVNPDGHHRRSVPSSGMSNGVRSSSMRRNSSQMSNAATASSSPRAMAASNR